MCITDFFNLVNKNILQYAVLSTMVHTEKIIRILIIQKMINKEMERQREVEIFRSKHECHPAHFTKD